jgi:hypothetical protein
MRPHLWLVWVVALTALGCSENAETPTSPSSSPATFTFSTTVGSKGWAARSFTTGEAGEIAVTLESVTPPIRVGFGVGIPRADGGGCNLTTSMESTGEDAAQLAVGAEPGTYCVKVFDIGDVPEHVRFSATVTHP